MGKKAKNVCRIVGVVSLLAGFFIAALILNTLPVRAASGINQQINFQGRLLNGQGAVVADGYYNIEFKIYQDGDGQSAGDATGSPAGSLKWSEDWLNSSSHGVQVKNGFLSVQLGSITPFGNNINWNSDTLWLSMNIGGTSATCTPFSGCTPDGEMLPMKRLSANAYSLNSYQLGGLTSSQFVQIAQGVQTDASNSTSIFVNKTGSGNILNLQSSGSDAFVITNPGDVSFGANANHSISVATAAANGVGKNLTISAGGAGTGGSTLAGGNLVLQGGAGGGTNGNGGNVSLDAGAKNGTGNDGTVTIGTNNASAITISKSGVTTTVAGNLTVSGTTKLSSLTTGIVHSASDGTLISGGVVLGTDTTGNYVAYIGTLTGLSTTGNSGAGATPTLSVNYGSSANTAVEGNTTLTCPSGTGNLTGTGNSITLGAGGTCNSLTVVNNPTFSGLVTGQSNTTGFALTGTPASSGGNTSLLQIGAAVSGGNSNTNGGTYIGLNAPNTGAGSAADFLNFQVGGTSKLVVANTGAITAGGQLTVNSGGIAVTGNSTINGTLGSLTGLTSSGTITFSGLNTAGIVHTNASGVLSTGGVILGTDTTGNYVASLGTLTGLTTTGNTGAGSTPTLSVAYGSSANQAVQGNTTLVCPSGTGNLTGTGNTITLGNGGTCNSLTIVNNPTFSGLITGQSNTTGLALSGTPIAGTGATSLLALGNAIAGGNAVTNGGTYIGINTPSSGAGSAADFINFQVGGTSKLVVTNGGALTAAGQLTVQSGGLTVSAGGATITGNSTVTGTLSGLTGLTSSGTITFSGLSTAGIVHNSAAGVLSTGGVVLGTDTTGNYVASLGSLSGLTTSGNTGAGSTPSLSVTYGSSAATAVQGNTTLTCPSGTGNLTGTGNTITLGTGGTCNSLTVVNNPTFSGQITGQASTTGFALTGAPAAGTGATSLFQIGNAIAGGNTTTNGGTYIGLNEPASGAGSAADFLNFQVAGTSKLVVTNGGAITAGGQLTVNSGGIAITGNSTISGTLGSLTGLTSSGTITFSGLNTAGIVHTNASGVLSTGGVVLGTDTTGSYVASLGTLTGLTTTGNGGASSTPTLSVTYGSAANTAVQGNTTLVCPSGTGNLSGTGNTITLGTGGTCNSLTVVNNPTFSGLITGQANTTGEALTGAPANNGTSSLLQLGNAIASGNTSTNGGTYLGINAPNTGAGSAADFINLQLNGAAKLLVTNAGAVTEAGQLTVQSGGITVSAGGVNITGNSSIAGTLSNLTGITSSGTITFSGLSTAGIVHNSAAGVLSTGAVALGTDTTGNYVANLGTLTGLTTTGNTGAGSTPTLSVTYGNAANTAVQGNTTLTCPSGTGNLSGTGNTITLGTGGTCNSLTVVNNPTFSGLITGQANTTGEALTGAPANNGTSSLLQLGNAISGGNTAANGGTYLGINEPGTGAGTAADFLNFQLNGTQKLLVTNAGAVTEAGALTVQSGGLTVSAGGATITGNSNITGVLGGLTGLSSSGTITFSGLSTAGIVHNSAAGTLSTGAVVLGTETTGNYVANLGTLTGLTTTGNTGSGATPTLSVTYGGGSNTAVQGNTTLVCPSGTGNLTGTGNTITLGNGGTCNSLTIVNNPTFSGQITGQASNIGLSLSGAPTAGSGNTSLLQLGSGLLGGNSNTNGGTYIGVNAPSTGAGSAADFLHFQLSGTTKLQVTNGGAVTEAGALTVSSGGITVSAGGATITGNSTIAGTLSSLTGLTSSGTITFSGLSTAGIVHNSAAGVLSTGGVVLGTDTTGNYVASLGALTGLTTSGNSGSGATPTLSVNYGSAANTAVQGNVTLTCPSGTGNLSGTGNTITLGSGGTCNSLTIVNNPTFSGLITGQANTTGEALTGAPLNNGTSSLLQLGSAIASGNTSTNGGTYLGLNAPSTGAGSAADFLNFQLSGTTKLLVTNAGAVTEAGQLTVQSGGITVSAGGLNVTGASTFSNQITDSAGTTGVALTGAPVAGSGNTSLLQLGSAILSGNTAVNGGTYIGLNAPSTGAGSAADFLNFQLSGTTKLQVTNGGAVTEAGALTVQSGGVSVTGNSTIAGTLGSLTGLTSSGTITFSGLSTAGIVHNSAAGVLSTGGVTLGTDTTGNYVAALGALTGLTTSGNSGAGSTPTISVNYGSGANQSVQGNTTLVCPSGTGNLSGNGNTITLGAGGTCNSLTIVNNPTFSGLITGQASTTGEALTGAPTNNGTSSLLQLGSAIAGGNTTASGGTYLGINEPSTGAGSAADFLNFQVNGTSKLLVTNAGAVTEAGQLTVQSGGVSVTAGGITVSAGGINVTGASTFNNQVTVSAATTALALTGAPAPGSGNTSLFQLGSAILSGNTAANGGTYIGLNAPSTGAGSAADFVNLQLSGTSKFLVANTGAVTEAGQLTVQSGGVNVSGNSTFSGQITDSAGTTGLALTGTPVAGTGATSLLQIGSAISGGNAAANGGTYIGLNAPATGAGSTADFLNFQANNTTKLQVTNSGALTSQSTITGTTLNGTTGINTGSGTGSQRIDASGNLVNIGNVTTSGASTFTTTGTNGFTFKPGSDTASAFLVQNAGGATILNVDSSNRQLKVYENAGATNYALIYYDTATATANYTASSGTVAVGTGAGAISITAGSSAAITVTANAASVWKTTAGTLTIQSGTSSDLILNPGSNIVSVNGSSVVKLGTSAGDPATCTVGAIVYNSSTNVFRGCQGTSPAWATLSSTTQTLQNTYTASTGGTTPEIKVDSTRGGVDIQDADTSISGILFAVRGTNAGGLGTSLLNVNSSNSTVNIGTSANSTSLLVLGNDTDSTFNAGTTSNAASEINGAMFYSSSDHNFMCGQAGQWVNCSGLLYSNTAVATAVNNCTNTCASVNSGNSSSVPANYCQAGRVMRISTKGVYSTTGTPTLQFGLYYGTDPTTRANDVLVGTASGTVTTGSSGSNLGWGVDFNVICFSTSSMNGQGTAYVATSNTATTTSLMYTNGSTTVSTGTAKNFYIFPTWSAASTSNTITAQQSIISGQ